MARRWRQGERPLAEEYLALHPELRDQPEAALELISEEVYLRQESGHQAAPADFLGRFPQWRRQVRALLGCHRLLAPHLMLPRFPAAGEVLGEFRLLAELGRGAYGRVFLATQPVLADRPVVLKLGPGAGQEHLSLARLQHTHIVPLHSAHDFPDRGLRALCLPYFGGTTLAPLLEALSNRPPRWRTGADVLQALCQAQAAAPAAVHVERPACRFLAGASYTQAVCWLGTCLADALHYAQERGLVHLDLKPSNVLLAADGQPMLLDFHLARAPLPAGAPAPAWLGGTPAYMAPEHQAALAAVRERRPIPAAVDGRADIYALGLLLHEALGGSLSGAVGTPARTLRRSNPQVTVGLADILARCLAPDPADRYPSAAALAEDLRRHLSDLPLCGVANRSPAERWRKWRRRRPYALPLLGLVLLAGAAGGLLLAHLGRQSHRAQDALREGQEYLHRRQYAEALDSFRHGEALVEDLPGNAGLARQLHDGMDLAERGQAARELHLLAERIRPLYGADLLPAAQARAAASHCRRVWRTRGLILERLGDLGPGEDVRADLLDLAIVWADLRVRGARPGRGRPAREEALTILAQAEALCGPSCVLYRERSSHAQALGLADVAEAAAQKAALLAPHSAWEHYALGRADFRAGDVGRAADRMEQALELQPQSLWANFYRGNCAYRLGQYADAVTAFSVCLVQAPGSAWCFRRDLGDGAMQRVCRGIRRSLRYGQGHRQEALAWVSRFGRGPEGRCAARFVDMFANGDSLYLPGDVREALVVLFRQAAKLGLATAVPPLDVVAGSWAAQAARAARVA
jgi:serine/threonine protein kinase